MGERFSWTNWGIAFENPSSFASGLENGEFFKEGSAQVQKNNFPFLLHPTGIFLGDLKSEFLGNFFFVVGG